MYYTPVLFLCRPMKGSGIGTKSMRGVEGSKQRFGWSFSRCYVMVNVVVGLDSRIKIVGTNVGFKFMCSRFERGNFV